MPPLNNCNTYSQAIGSCINKERNQPISSFQAVTVGKSPMASRLYKRVRQSFESRRSL